MYIVRGKAVQSVYSDIRRKKALSKLQSSFQYINVFHFYTNSFVKTQGEFRLY